MVKFTKTSGKYIFSLCKDEWNFSVSTYGHIDLTYPFVSNKMGVSFSEVRAPCG